MQPGRVLGVLGPSGAGKTTLFRVIAGELTPHAGRVVIGGRDMTGSPLWRRARAGLGYVPQVPSVLFDLSVRNNIATFERVTRSPRRAIDERAAEVGLVDRLDVRARELSGGERRRLEVLRALTAEPSVLIVDEPFAGVDPTWARELVEVLRRRAERGMAILIADHRVREALMLCNDALLLADGAVEAAASATDFAEHPAVRERYLG